MIEARFASRTISQLKLNTAKAMVSCSRNFHNDTYLQIRELQLTVPREQIESWYSDGRHGWDVVHLAALHGSELIIIIPKATMPY